MKNKLRIICSVFVIILFSSNVSMAGFFIKKGKAAVSAAAISSTAQITENTPAASNAEAAPIATEHATKIVKKSFFSRIFHKVKEAAEAAVPQWLYIVLAIIGFGWLAMGINDNFEGTDWLISLLLSIIFWLPGLIYSLIKMSNYY